MSAEAIRIEGSPITRWEAIEAIWVTSWKWVVGVPFIAYLIALGLYQCAVRGWLPDSYFIFYLIFASLILVGILLVWIGYVQKLFGALTKEPPQGHASVTVSSGGVSLQDKNATVDLGWTTIGRLHSSRSLVYFRVSKPFVFIAKRELTLEQHEQLRGLLAANGKA